MRGGSEGEGGRYERSNERSNEREERERDGRYGRCAAGANQKVPAALSVVMAVLRVRVRVHDRLRYRGGTER